MEMMSKETKKHLYSFNSCKKLDTPALLLIGYHL